MIDKEHALNRTFSDIDLGLEFLPIIRELLVIEIDLDDKKSTTHSFTKLEDAIEYIFDFNLRKYQPVPISFTRNGYTVEMNVVTSEDSIFDYSGMYKSIVKLLYENWCHEYDKLTGKRIEREPLTNNEGEI